MKILLLLEYLKFEFVLGFVQLLKEKPDIFIYDKTNKYIINYCKNNELKLLTKKNTNKIKDYKNIVVFDFKPFWILNRINYKGNIISHAHGISLKKYFPSKGVRCRT